MVDGFSYLLNGMALGLAAGTSPGAFQTYLMSETLARGWRVGLRVAASPLISDGPIIILMTLILKQLSDPLLGGLSLAGSAILLFLAWGIFQRWRHPAIPAAAPPPREANQSLWRGVLVNATNPGPYIFWGTIQGPLLLEAGAQSPLWAVLFLLGFYAVLLLCLAALVLLSHQLRRLPASYLSRLWLVSAILLVALALVLLRSGLQRLGLA
jgi:threonine/homoserine/homoserine lactone efflux protein